MAFDPSLSVAQCSQRSFAPNVAIQLFLRPWFYELAHNPEHSFAVRSASISPYRPRNLSDHVKLPAYGHDSDDRGRRAGATAHHPQPTPIIRIRYIMEYLYLQLDQIFTRIFWQTRPA